jgi:metal-sulfur cluster biosynthetic enzyme
MSEEQAIETPTAQAAAVPVPAEGSASSPTVDDVMDALSNVIDPELGLDFVELGLIYGVEVSDGDVTVTFTLTTPGCPIGPQVNEQIEEFVGELEGVKQVASEMVFTPPWSPEKMSEDAKFALGY